jgi:hypothetical protein
VRPAELVVALLLASAALGAAERPAVGNRVRIDLPAGRPATIALDLEHDGLRREVVLERHSLRAPAFRVRTHSEAAGEELFAPLAPATYRGRIVGEPHSEVFGHLGADGLTLRVVSETKPDWRLRPDGAPGIHRTFDVVEGIERPIDCPLDAGSAFDGDGGHARTMTFAGQHLAQIAFDVDFQYYQLKGSTVQGAVDAVEAILNQVDFFYARDLLVTYELTEVLVRTTQFYFPTGGGNLLDLFRAEWNSNQAAVPRDMAHLMTNKSGIEFGGLAWVGAVCNTLAYGWSLDSANIVGHELGHNWGSGHCHDLAPCNNMCGGCFFIGPETKNIMTGYRDSLSCLDDAGAYPAPLPPYAHPETLTLTRDELVELAPTPFDVLGNDHDGNLDPLAIDSYDTQTVQAGSISLSSGSGPEGRDELVYAPPGFVFPGSDQFDYTVGDGTGLMQTGVVTIDVPARGQVGYWKLDHATGHAAHDSSNHGRHGETEGGPLWGFGRYRRALSFDGVDDAVLIPPLEIRSNRVSLSAWVKRNGDQSSFAGIVFSRDGNTIAGLSFGNANELRYNWNGLAETFDWDSGLVVPDQQWVLVALVVEPDQATIHLYDGSLQSAVHFQQHALEEFDGTTRFGHDPSGGSRRFRGLMDDVRISDRALSTAEILDLAERGGAAVGPNPLDAGLLLSQVAELSWLPGLEADSHDVYLGDDYEAVRDATPESPEFVGNRSSRTLAIGPLAPGSIRAWRIDERVGAEVIRGAVWLFEPAATGAHWKLDESGEATAVDSEGGNDGSYQGGGQQGEPGATPSSGSSVRFDGTDDSVELPALDLNAGELTISGWARRDGPQSNFAGIVFSRAGTTVAGISSLSGGGLRYHWNDAYWDWDSGLVLPDDEWVFFALVVRSDMATIYLGRNDELTSSYNATAHGVEEFDGPLALGRDGTAGRYFRGWLDDVHVFRAALTPRDVETIYSSALGTPAGEIPSGAQGEPLRIGKAAGDSISLSWSPSCLVSAVDYAVYEGALGDFGSHVERSCSTAGSTMAVFSPASGDRYYLVVPLSQDREGGYGAASSGPRGEGLSACLPQSSAGCD